MHTAIEITIALFVMFAVFAALRGNWAGALAAVVGALVLGVLAMVFGGDEEHDRWGGVSEAAKRQEPRRARRRPGGWLGTVPTDERTSEPRTAADKKDRNAAQAS
jgi:hypothetical protein